MSTAGPEIRIMGIDPGSQITGWGLIGLEGTHLRGLAWGVIRLAGPASLGERLVRLEDELAALLAEHRPDEVAVEEVFVARNAKSALILGHARGVVLLSCARRGYVPAEYPANTVKQSVLGQAGQAATKERVGFMVRAILGLSEVPEPADAADALACSICHAHKRGLPQ